MRKTIFLTLILVPWLAFAGENTCIDTSGNFTAPTCNASGEMLVSAAVSGVTVTAATFAAIDATTSIGAAYASSVDLPNDTKIVILDNQTNGDVMVSMDGGVSDTFHLKAGDVLSLNLVSATLKTTGDVQTKDGTTASSTGTFYVSSIK